MRMNRTVLVILSGILCSLIQYGCNQPIMISNLTLDSGGYISFGHTIQRNFFVDKTIQDSLQLLWEFETNGNQANNSVILVDKYLFVNDLSGRIYAVDRLTGKLIGFEKIGSAVSATPIYYTRRLFLIAEYKEEHYSSLVVFDLVNSKVLNEDRIAGPVTSEMLKMDDGIVVLSSYGELIKYNLVGSRLWSVKTNKFTKSSPASDGMHIFFANENGDLISVDAVTGKIIYQNKIAARVESGITVDSSLVYFGDSNGSVYGIDKQSGKVFWRVDTKRKIISTPVYDSANLIVGNLGGDIYCCNKFNGSLKWKTETGGVINSTPLLFKNMLLQPNLNKQVNVIEIEKGKIIRSIPFAKRVKLSPVFYDGIVYLGADRGTIYAYKVLDKN